jgi:hypothetical protein
MVKLHKLLLTNILKITQIINIKTAISNIYYIIINIIDSIMKIEVLLTILLETLKICNIYKC